MSGWDFVKYYEKLVSPCGPGEVARLAAVGRLPGDAPPFFYLATPYTKLAKAGAADFAARDALRAAADLAVHGVTAFTPIGQSHHMCAAVAHALDPLDEKFCETWCAPALFAAHGLIIPPVAGWRDSVGCRFEAMTAVSLGMPIFVMEDL